MNSRFMHEAIRLSREKMCAGEGGPFGAVIVRNDDIISHGWNRVIASNDPTAHAEIMAIRLACEKLGRFHLEDCVLYASCEPCPMCLSAIYWARLQKMFFANTREDAAKIGFDDAAIYSEVARPIARRKLPMRSLLRAEAQKVFQEWLEKPDKVPY